MKVIKNYLYNAGYQLLAVLLPLITAPYVSRVIGAHGIGINTATNSTIQYFILLGSIGIGLYGNREIAYLRSNKQAMSEAFWEIQILKMVMVTISYGAFLVYLAFCPVYKEYMLIQSLNLIAAAVDISWLYMGLEDFKKTVLRNTMVKLASAAMIFMFVKDANDTWVYIFVLAISVLGGNLTLWPYVKKTLVKVDFKKLHPFRHFKPTIALFIPQIATQVYLVLNKTMLWAMVNSDVAGFYDRSDTLVRLVLTLVTATGTVMLPHVANAFHEGKEETVNNLTADSFDFVSCISIPMFAGLAAIGQKLAPLFFGPQFKPVGMAVCLEAIVIVLIGWSNVIGQQYLLPTNKIKIYTGSVVSGAIVNLILNLPFIYLWGLHGAVFATICSEIVVTGYQMWHVRNNLSLKKMFINVPKYALASLTMFIVVNRICAMFNLTSTFKSILAIASEIILGTIIYGGMLLLMKPTILNKLGIIVKKIRSRKHE
ncbi:MOP superfamily flippase transporter [Ligilactobacillus ruminis]|uniref:oligosaccharide flippase family protein n=1 Tax=Ligilactobacillus ruminis TaxID=1623 RepID=UPI00062CB4CC|nr:polysaccharide biosynthesis C-terminal domain-containing protein [Ligilactobacillus ruminis]KLA45140.1 MOP superfamily flippase transporter [Ligilactobacillus ruminis]